MIIGGNNNGNRNPLAHSPEFNNKFRQNTNNTFIKNNNPQQPISSNHYKDICNTKEMNERSYEILKQRYDNGLISINEFKRKCEQLRKRG